MENILLNFLKWIEEEKFVLYKDGKWYSPKRYIGEKTIYYKHEELIRQYLKEKKVN